MITHQTIKHFNLMSATASKFLYSLPSTLQFGKDYVSAASGIGDL
jgi:hypothetical protein